MTTKQRFDEKDPTEKLVLTFDFTQGLSALETLMGVPAVEVNVDYGTDIAPTAILNGPAAFDTTNKLVFVPIEDGLNGVDYDIVVSVQTSNPQKFLVLACILPVRDQ